MIAAPYTTVMRRLRGVDYISSIDVAAVSADMTDEAKWQIEELLRERHRIAPGAEDDFQVRNIADVAESATESTNIMTILLGSIAGISLIVGGIGIMNIMLVSVTERTKEIGIRMAVGARRRDVLIQFLIESAIISGAGGIIGILLGYLIATIVTAATSLPSKVDPVSIIVAIMMSTLVGLFFGIYPANRAARLNPVEALRSEQ